MLRQQLLLERRRRQGRYALMAVLGLFALIVGLLAIRPVILQRLALAEVSTVEIPEGEGPIGTDGDDASSSTHPRWIARLPTFHIETHEVTNRQYAYCVEANVCNPSSDAIACQAMDSRNNVPVRGLTGRQAQDYCNWLNRRLPTEIEWERAARGDTGTRWPWGAAAPSVPAVQMGGPPGTAPLTGPLPVDRPGANRSGVGVSDLIGNVAEWTLSYASQSYDLGRYDQDVWQGNSNGISDTKELALRGGSWAVQVQSSMDRESLRTRGTFPEKSGGCGASAAVRCVLPASPPRLPPQPCRSGHSPMPAYEGEIHANSSPIAQAGCG